MSCFENQLGKTKHGFCANPLIYRLYEVLLLFTSRHGATYHPPQLSSPISIVELNHRWVLQLSSPLSFGPRLCRFHFNLSQNVSSARVEVNDEVNQQGKGSFRQQTWPLESPFVYLILAMIRILAYSCYRSLQCRPGSWDCEALRSTTRRGTQTGVWTRFVPATPVDSLPKAFSTAIGAEPHIFD